MTENEYFIVANSFAKSFISDTSTSYINGIDEYDAMERFTNFYSHPAGLYAVNIYKNADDYYKNETPLLTFRSKHNRR